MTWTPSETRRENERTLEMFVAGDATPLTLRCVGECGAPALGFAEKEYCVFAMQMGKFPNPCFVNFSAWAFASAESSTPLAPYTLVAMAAILSSIEAERS